MPNTRFDFAENLAVAMKSCLDDNCDVVVHADSEATVSLRLPLDDELMMIANFRLDNPVTIDKSDEEVINFYPVNSVDTHCMGIESVEGPDGLIARIMTAMKSSGKIGDINQKASELGVEGYIKGHKDTTVPREKRKKMDSVEHAIAFVAERYSCASAAVFAVRVLSS